MTEVRSDFSAVTFRDQIFAIGGFNGTDVLATVEVFDVEQQLWRPYTSLVTPRSSTRCKSAYITQTIIHHSGNAQGDCVRGQGLCSGWVRWHLEAAFGGVLHPWTSRQQTKVAPGGIFRSQLTWKTPGCQGGRHVGTSLQLLRGHPQWSSCRDGRLQVRLQKSRC